MNINKDNLETILQKAIAATSKMTIFEQYHGSDQSKLGWLRAYGFPQTYDQLFEEIVQFPRYPRNNQPYCNAAVVYCLLQVMKKNLNDHLEELVIAENTHFSQEEKILRHGSVFVKGDVSLEIGKIFLTETLRVEGNLSDWDESSQIIVLGDLEAKNLSSSGEIVVGGDLKVENILHVHRNDNSLRVEGNILCGHLINNDHSIVTGRSIHANRILDCMDPCDIEFMRCQLGIPVVEESQGVYSLDSDELHKAISSHCIES